MAVSEYFYNISVFKFMIWVSISALGYIIANICLIPIPCINPCYKCWDKCIYLPKKKFILGHQKKTSYEWYRNISYTILFSILIYFISDLENRIEFDYELLILPLISFGTIPVYGVISQMTCLESSISKSSCKNYTGVQICAYTLVGCIIGATYGYQIYLSYLDKTIFYYILSQIVIVLYYIIMWYKYVKESINATIHIHHWFLSFGCCLLFRYNTIITNIMFSIMFGIFLEGSVCYGLVDIFKDKVTPSVSLQDF